DPSLKPTDTNMPYRGRIGSVNVLIHCLPEPTGTADGAYMAQNMTPSFGLIENILITGLDPGVADAGMRLGDLIICPAMARLGDDAQPSSPRTPNSTQRAVDVLQKEVGADGRWLSSNLPLTGSNVSDLFQSY